MIKYINFGSSNRIHSKEAWLNQAKQGHYNSIVIESEDYDLLDEIIESLPKYVKAKKQNCSSLINGEIVKWPLIKFDFTGYKNITGEVNEQAFKRFNKIIEAVEKFKLETANFNNPNSDFKSVYKILEERN